MAPASADKLKHQLSAHGPMGVADYMAWCLTASDSSYYRSGNPLGASGDFVTAPEVSQIFGELVAVWAIQVWQSMGAPASFVLAELGPGRGTLMQDALRAARAVPAFRAGAQVNLVETSATLRELQGRTLASACEPQWHRSFASLPQGPLIVIANEFFDALPVEQHVYEDGSWHKRVIAMNDDGEPAFAAGRLSVPPGELLPAREPRDGDILEHRPAARVLMREIGNRAGTAPAALLIADYGYERRDYGDTLQAVREHGYANPLENPGETDLSAHVNFAELTEAADGDGLSTWGPMAQSEFLLSLGMEQRLRQLMNTASEEQRAALFLGARRLVDPFQMGSLFKVMAITSRDLPAPPPFSTAAQLPPAAEAPYSTGAAMDNGAR